MSGIVARFDQYTRLLPNRVNTWSESRRESKLRVRVGLRLGLGIEPSVRNSAPETTCVPNN